MTPAMAILLAFAVYITISLVYLALCNWNIRSPSPSFSGPSNFIAIARDNAFWQSLMRSAVFTVSSVFFEIILGFFMAYVLSKKIRALGLVRTLLIVPMAMTPVVIAMFWKIMYDPTLGPINYFLSLIGIRGPEWLGSTSTAFLSVIIVNVWQWVPFSFLVLTAGMAALPEEPYESARIDGANEFQIMLKLTLPMLKPIFLMLMLLRGVDAFKAFDLVFVMTRGGPGEVTQLLPYYIYLRGFQWFDLGYAAALSLVVLLFVNCVVSLFIKKTGVLAFYED